MHITATATATSTITSSSAIAQKILPIKKIAAVFALFCLPGVSLSHVVLLERSASALGSYRAVFQVGHGCDGSPTKQLKITLPAGLQATKPMPKPGWTLTTEFGKLTMPFDNGHGVSVTQGVTHITWTANTQDSFLPDAHYDEFVLRTRLPKETGPLWFKVLQDCEKGQTDWAEIPASGTSTKGLKSPAALLEVLPAK